MHLPPGMAVPPLPPHAHQTCPSLCMPCCAAQVAATAWRIQFAEYWQREQGSKTGDSLRLATAQLRSMLVDEDEIKWRRRAVVGLVGRGAGLLA